MDINKTREAVIAVYGTPGWKQRVLKMSDSQVIAVYMRFRAQGKL